MGDKKQVATYIREDQYSRLKSSDRPMTEIHEKALDLYFQAHGEASPEQIKKQIQEIDEQIATLREETLAQIEELQEERDQLTEALAEMHEQATDYDELFEDILTGLEENPSQNVLAYESEIQQLVTHPQSPNHTTRDDILQELRDRASNYDVEESRLRDPSASTPAVAADGDGEESETVDTSRYNFGDEE